MNNIKYSKLSDTDKLGLLQLMYHELQKKTIAGTMTARDIEHKELIIAETELVYSQLKQRSN